MCMKTAFIVLLFASAILAQNHILITEIVVTPTDGEFIEIYNNGNSEVDLSDYYLTDATHFNSGSYYYNIVTGTDAGGGSGTFDFHARFPKGRIAAGEFQTIALNGTGFVMTYGKYPTYELYDTNEAITDLREALSGSIYGGSTLSNSGEVVILYYWDGQTDLVSDVDYYLWGDKESAVDKTGINIDGPDGDTTPSTYLPDTPIASQVVAADGAPHAFGESSQRTTLIETGETQSGGNGITGHNETSESLASSFLAAVPNPGTGPAGGTGNIPLPITNLTEASGNLGLSNRVSDDGSTNFEQMEVKKGDDEVLGTTFSDLSRSGRGESPMNNLICDAMIEATQSDFSVINFGGIHADLKSGQVTRRDLFRVLPFENTLVVFQMKGEFLKQLLESKITYNRRGLAIGGGKVEFDPARDDGNKITYSEVGNYPLYPEKEYRVVTTDYLAEGNSGMDLLLQVSDANIVRTGILLRGAVSEYIQKYSPLEIQLNGRWIRK